MSVLFSSSSLLILLHHVLNKEAVSAPCPPTALSNSFITEYLRCCTPPHIRADPTFLFHLHPGARVLMRLCATLPNLSISHTTRVMRVLNLQGCVFLERLAELLAADLGIVGLLLRFPIFLISDFRFPISDADADDTTKNSDDNEVKLSRVVPSSIA